MRQLTIKERASFRVYANDNMVESDGTQSQWADYTVRLLDESEKMARLLLEARDALPAITQVSARLRRIDLTLGRRIEDILLPWEE